MNNKQNEELQSRREFFKKAAKATLPILAVAALGGSLLTSCEPNEPQKSSKPTGCSGCSGSCSSSCSGDCDGGCTNNCDSLCGGDCWHYCRSEVKS